MRIKNYQDRRVRRTQKLIRQAFLSLIEEKDYNQITVTDIINRADFNRTTFYRHYYDKDDLAYEIIDDYIALFIDALMFPYRMNPVLHFAELSEEDVIIFEHILQHQDFYRLWSKLKTIPLFTEKYSDAIHHTFSEKVIVDSKMKDVIDQKLCMQFYSYGLAGLIFNWIGTGFSEPADYMTEQLIHILKSKPITAKMNSDKEFIK